MEAVDRAVLDRLADELGDPEAVVEIVRGYLDLLPGRLDELDLAGGAEADAEVRAQRLAAHTLKSGAMLLGADALARAAEAVEHGGGSPADVRREAQEAARAWRRWLAQALARHPRNP